VYHIGQGQEEKENSVSKTTRKATENHLALFSPIHGMDCTNGSKDMGVNVADSQLLTESRPTGTVVRRSRSSFSEILIRRVGRKKFHLK